MGKEAKSKSQQNLSLENLSSDRSLLEKFAGWLDKISGLYNRILHYISSAVLFLIMFLTLFDVIGRAVFNSPIKGTFEVTGFALALMVFFSLGAAQIKGDHIEIDFITGRFRKRAQHYWNSFVYLVLFVVMVLTSWQLVVYAQRMLNGNNVSGDLGIPLYIIVFVTAIGALGFSLALVNSSIQNLLKAVKDK